jgi:hypothetical protein
MGVGYDLSNGILNVSLCKQWSENLARQQQLLQVSIISIFILHPFVQCVAQSIVARLVSHSLSGLGLLPTTHHYLTDSLK